MKTLHRHSVRFRPVLVRITNYFHLLSFLGDWVVGCIFCVKVYILGERHALTASEGVSGSETEKSAKAAISSSSSTSTATGVPTGIPSVPSSTKIFAIKPSSVVSNA